MKFDTLRIIYYGIFSSILLYGAQIWGQSNNHAIKKLQIIQNKALRTINFKPAQSSVNPLYKKCKILKLADNIKLQNFLFAYDNLKNNLPSSLKDSLSTVDSIHIHETRSVTYKHYIVPTVKTQMYGVNSINFKSVNFWNFLYKHFHSKKLHTQKRNFCKSFVTNFLLNEYE